MAQVGESNVTYSWARGSGGHKVSAQVAGEVCAGLEERNQLTPGNLVDVSRPDEAPLHGEFEWDDTVAAERYRETQARHVIRSIVVVREMPAREKSELESGVSHIAVQDSDDDGEQVRLVKVRAYHSDQPNGSHKAGRYESVDRMLTNDESRGILLDNAMGDMRAFIRKYGILKELSGVIGVMNAYIGEVE